MNDATPHLPKRLHCRDLDGKQTGILILSDDRIELYFVGYDEFVHVSEDGPAYVVTEEGRVVSLHANVSGRHSSHRVTIQFGGNGCGRESNERREICQSGIISNLAVIGTDAWRPDDSVRRLTFDVAQTERILRHPEKLRSLARAPHLSDDALKLYRAVAGNVALTAGYAVTYSIDTNSLNSCQPTFSVEFAVGCPLDEIAAHLVRYLSFLSFVLGGRMAPAAVRVDRLTLEEIVRALEAGTYLGEHEVMWNWPADEDEAKDLDSTARRSLHLTMPNSLHSRPAWPNG